MTRTEGEIKTRILICNVALKALRDNDPRESDPEFCRKREAAIERVTEDLHALVEELRELNQVEEQPEPVKVGMKPAKLTNKVTQ